MRLRILAAQGCLLLAAACGSSAGASPGAPLGAAFALPRLVLLGAQTSRSMVAEAVWFATTTTGAGATGSVTRTGTITVSGDAAGYSPTPSEKLVVRGLPVEHEFEAVEVVGNPQAASAQQWLALPHRLAYTHRVAGTGEVRIDEQFDGTQFVATVRGQARLAGVDYAVDLTVRGVTRGGGDLDGSEARTGFDVTGTLRGQGCEIAVEEQHVVDFASAVSLRLLHSQRGWASQIRSSIGNTLKVDGVEWKFVGVKVETGAKEKGGQRSDDVVACSGALTRAGVEVGKLELANGLVRVVGPDLAPLPLDLGR
ncbi:MAG: hypothetical protein JNK15_18430 [Planctomycetes bacterium]|nr:hypothetical protein [Planctomycetota bacterium]